VVNPPRKKGTAWETAVVSFLASCGLLARRKAQSGSKDEGDIELEGVLRDVLIEAKNTKGASLAEWVDEACAEALNAGARVAVVWHHRRLHASPGKGYVTMQGDHFVSLLEELQSARNLVAAQNGERLSPWRLWAGREHRAGSTEEA
jgi:hypothetical protein